MTDEVAALERELRAEVSEGIAALPGEHLGHLAAAIAGRRAAQHAAAEAAIEEGLGFLPRVLRALVVKALF